MSITGVERIIESRLMKRVILFLLCFVAVVLCAFECDDFYSTRFYIVNMTEEMIVIDSYVGGGYSDHKKARLKPGESFEIHSIDAESYFHVIEHRHVSMSACDGTLIRFWTTYYKSNDLNSALDDCNAQFFWDYGVRQFHDEKEWEYAEYKDRCEWTFNILPEDLIPLSEFVEKLNLKHKKI